MERKKRGERSGERERGREGGVRERERWGEYERDRWGSEWVRERGRLLKRERERERERRGEYENREGKEKSLKNRCAKLYAYNECEHSVHWMNSETFK